MKILHLDKEMVTENMDRLMEIDRAIIMDDPWTAYNFLMDLEGKWEFSLVALENNIIIGFLICSVRGNNIHIHRIAISPEHQRRKVGSALIEHLVTDCYKSGINSITLKVRDFNINAQKFYEKLGFRKIASHGFRYLYGREL